MEENLCLHMYECTYLCDSEEKKRRSIKAKGHGVLRNGLCVCFFVFAHTQTHRLLKCVQTMNGSLRWIFFLLHEEQSPEADNTSAAEPTFYRDNISVCPQRAAGITVVNFTLLSVNHGVERCLETHPFGSARQANHFQEFRRGKIDHYPQICKIKTTKPCSLLWTAVSVSLWMRLLSAAANDHDCWCLRWTDKKKTCESERKESAHIRSPIKLN